MQRLIKIILSISVAACATYPYLAVSGKSGAIETVFNTGIAITTLTVILFFIAIAFYCKALETCLRRVDSANRAANPKSVWLMFLIPYNIVEDFFIMINVSNSIANEARTNSHLANVKDYGLVTGIGWCIAQVLSLVPNWAGQVAGLLALVLWIAHWIFISKINRLLTKAKN